MQRQKKERYLWFYHCGIGMGKILKPGSRSRVWPGTTDTYDTSNTASGEGVELYHCVKPSTCEFGGGGGSSND